jgi:C2H2 type zinc finger protein
MHTGSDMGGPAFSSRRPNASSLSSFDLPPPQHLSSSQKYHYHVNGTQANQTPGSLASVGNLLTPPSTIGGAEVSPSSSASVGNSSSSAPAYANGSYSSWSPSQAPAYYTTGHTQQFSQPQRVSYSPANNMVRGNPHSPPSSENGQIPQQYDLPPFTSAAPMTPATLPSMGPQQTQAQQQMQGQMIGSNTPVSNAPHPSPVNAQEAFRPPPTPTYYQQQPSAPHSPFPYTTGPPQQQLTSLSGGPIQGRPHMSPNPGVPAPPLSAPPVQSPHMYQGRFPYGPVMSNIHNPNTQPMLVGGLPHGMVAGFNSGHAASMQGMYSSPTPAPAPPTDRPFKCDQCPQSFNRNHDLKRHKRIHLAVKPFPCKSCDKSFSRKDALKVRFISAEMIHGTC